MPIRIVDRVIGSPQSGIGGLNPSKFTYTGNASTTAFNIPLSAFTNNPANYRVEINGVTQEPVTDYFLSGSNIVFVTPPLLGEKIVIVANNIVGSYDFNLPDGSVTTAKLAPVLATGTTTPRAIQERFSDVISVKDFGAVGDGVTNDTAAFQAAANTKKNILVPETSRYRVTSRVTGNFYSTNTAIVTGGGPVPIATTLQSYPQTPFGATGMRIIAGSKRDAHYGWGGIIPFSSGKWVHIYRKGATHGVSDNSELRAQDSYDCGKTWTNDRLLYQNATHDIRPDAPRLLANNRGGFFASRPDEGTTHFSPLFFKTDDEGVTWSSAVITTSSPYTFAAANGGILDFPSSQGGNDLTGFISYGYLSANGLDALTTTNNGDTWTIVNEVATGQGIISSISENVGVRVGDQNKWIFFCRPRTEDGTEMIVFVTNNMLNWGTPRRAGVELNANPPGCLYDSKTNKIHILNTARGTRDIDNLENYLLHIEADADQLYNANGSLSALGLQYSVLTPVPHWPVSYITPFEYNNRWYATYTCGETGFAGGDIGAQLLIGDFAASSTDTMGVVKLFLDHQWRTNAYNTFNVVASSTAVDNYPLKIYNNNETANTQIGSLGININTGGYDFYKILVNNNDLYLDANNCIFGLNDKVPGVGTATLHLGVQGADYPAAVSYSGATGTRKHYVFHNLNGEVGSISTSASGTAFNVTSDELYKDFVGDYLPEKAIEIIKADPVREFYWKPEFGGYRAVGWGAQTSYKVSSDLATPGGWFKDDMPCSEDAEGAIYVPWGIDQSKRTPYLWAAVSYLIDRVSELEDKLSKVEGLSTELKQLKRSLGIDL